MVGHLAPLSSPIPRYKAVWLIFFMLGLGTLLPWNFFMTATQVRLGGLGSKGHVSLGMWGPDLYVWAQRERCPHAFLRPPQYFTDRLNQSQNVSSVIANVSRDIQTSATPATPAPERSFLSAIFNNVMTLCAMLPLLIFTCLNSFLHQR